MNIVQSYLLQSEPTEGWGAFFIEVTFNKGVSDDKVDLENEKFTDVALSRLLLSDDENEN